MSDFVALVTGLAWPALIGSSLWYFRGHVTAGVDALQRQMAAGASLKWKDFEFVGISLSEFKQGSSSGYRTEPASAEDLSRREAKYKEQKDLFLVHRAVATGKLHPESNFPNYDVLIKLISHKNYGRLNDVKRVEYYFGKYFGREAGKSGAKYVVNNGSDAFAVRVDAYGPTLCEATVHFHDGSVATCSRYLDFGGAPYSYDPLVTEYDAKLSTGRPA